MHPCLGIRYDPADDNKMFIEIDNTEFLDNGGQHISVEYDPDIGDPTCVGIDYAIDDQDIDGDPDTLYYLQWKEFSCRRSEDTVCEVDFKRSEVCKFGKDQAQQAVTTDRNSVRNIFFQTFFCQTFFKNFWFYQRNLF